MRCRSREQPWGAPGNRGDGTVGSLPDSALSHMVEVCGATRQLQCQTWRDLDLHHRPTPTPNSNPIPRKG